MEYLQLEIGSRLAGRSKLNFNAEISEGATGQEVIHNAFL
jgi:hypothetical protein